MELRNDQNARALRAQVDEDLLERFVSENRRFILRCASRVCGRFVTESDDAYEVALVAFWEAVRAFDGTGDFNGFAALVIRRRLLDHFDRSARRSREVSIGSSMTWDDAEDAPAGMLREVQQKLAQEDKGRDVRDEIAALGGVLNAYGFSFFDLAEASPKAEKTKRCCARAVNWMLELAERVLTMRRTRSLPVSAIVKALELARKLIERHRRYIIAATEILDGDYPKLSEYMDYIKKERTL